MTLIFVKILDLVVSMFKYYKEMIQFTKDNPAQVLNLHFEEMKRVNILFYCFVSSVIFKTVMTTVTNICIKQIMTCIAPVYITNL